MLDYEFYNPTRIVFGRGTISRLDTLIPLPLPARRLVLIGGESARKTGTLAEVKAALGHREVQEFGGIEPNPTCEALMKAVESAQGKKAYASSEGGSLGTDQGRAVSRRADAERARSSSEDVAPTLLKKLG